MGGGGGGRKKWSQQKQQEWEAWRRSSDGWQRPSWTNAKTTKEERYDSVKVPQAQASAGTSVSVDEVPGTGEGQLHREVQRALTSAKKADMKLRKLQEEKQRRGAQWEAYSKSLKQKYITQRKEYEQDLARIQADMEDALAAGKEASTEVRSLIENGLPRAAPMDETPTGWEELLAQSDDTQVSGFLKDAMAMAQAGRRVPAVEATSSSALMSREAAARLLAATMLGVPPGLRQVDLPVGLGHEELPGAAPGAPAPVMPVSTTTGERPGEPHAYTGGQAAMEGSGGPFPPSSPTGRSGTLPVPAADIRTAAERSLPRTSPHHPGQRDLSRLRQPTNEVQPRENVKDATKVPRPAGTGPAASGLAAKLDQARYEALHGVGALAAVPNISIADDDPDELVGAAAEDLEGLDHLS
eukprot:s9_g11.t1